MTKPISSIVVAILVVALAVLGIESVLAQGDSGGNTQTAVSVGVDGIQMMVTVNGLEKGEKAALRLLLETDTATEKVLVEQAIAGEEGGSMPVEIRAKLADGNYQLLLEAPSKYFRDPKGYLFQVYQSEIVNPSGVPLAFEMIPPAAQKYRPFRPEDLPQGLVSREPRPEDDEEPVYMAERMISISGPANQTEPVDRDAGILSIGYHYAGPMVNLDNTGVWGRSTVVNPSVYHQTLPPYQFVAERAYVQRYVSGAQYRIEAGWIEASWLSDVRYIYEQDSTNPTLLNTYGSPPSTQLQTRVRKVSGTTWYAEYWNPYGGWIILKSADIGITTAEHAENCGEVYSADGSHPNLPSSTFDVGYLCVNSMWDQWDGDYGTQTQVYSDLPYHTHMTTQYYRFYIHN